MSNGGAFPPANVAFKIGDKIRLRQNTVPVTYTYETVVATAASSITVTNVAENQAANIQIAGNITILQQGKTSDERVVKRFTLFYQPPLSIFSIAHAIPGSSKHEIDMVPYSNENYQRNVIESLLAAKTHTPDGNTGDFRFKVTRMAFKCCQCDGPLYEKGEFFLDLQETRCQITTLTSGARSQYSLDISPATNALTMAFQSELAESTTQFSQTKFKMQNDEELSLVDFYIRYGGVQKPQPNDRVRYNLNDSGAVELRTDLTMEQYGRNLMYNGSYYDSSAETLEQWRNRGIYYHFPYPKTGSDRETRCYVSTQFANNNLTGSPRLLLFNHFNKVCILKYDNGTLNEVIVNEV